MLGILTAGILNGSSHLWAGKAISPKDSRSFFPLILSRFAPLAFHTEGFTFSQGNEGMTTCDDKDISPQKRCVYSCNLTVYRKHCSPPPGSQVAGGGATERWCAAASTVGRSLGRPPTTMPATNLGRWRSRSRIRMKSEVWSKALKRECN